MQHNPSFPFWPFIPTVFILLVFCASTDSPYLVRKSKYHNKKIVSNTEEMARRATTAALLSALIATHHRCSGIGCAWRNETCDKSSDCCGDAERWMICAGRVCRIDRGGGCQGVRNLPGQICGRAILCCTDTCEFIADQDRCCSPNRLPCQFNEHCCRGLFCHEGVCTSQAKPEESLIADTDSALLGAAITLLAVILLGLCAVALGGGYYLLWRRRQRSAATDERQSEEERQNTDEQARETERSEEEARTTSGEYRKKKS